jgi:hypothetical protein
MDFDKKIASAKASRRFKDQPVILDSGVSEEMERLEAELKAADTDVRLGAKSAADEIQERLDELADESTESTETIRVYRLPGRDWVNLTSQFQPRPNVAVDRVYGYNVDAVIEAAIRFRDPKTDATYAFRLDGDTPVEISDDQWTGIFDVISGREFSLIRDAVYELNEYEPQERLNALVKGSGAASRSVSK